MGYPKHIHDKAWQILDQRAAQARETNAFRKQQISRDLPQVTQIQREMALGATGITRAVIASPDKAGELIESLAQQNLNLQQKRRDLLVQGGYPPDYLEEQFGCPLCKDQGYVQSRMCSCLQKLLQEQAYAELCAAAPVKSSTFQQFSLDLYPDTPDETGVSPRNRMADVLAFCKRYATSFSSTAESLLLIGKTGLGKTHLSLAIAAEVMHEGYGIVYTPVQKLMDTLESEKFSYNSDKKELYAGHIHSAQTCDLLILDDLGTEFLSQFSVSVIYNIINTRQVEGRPTVISTNLEVEEIESRYSERTLSRLLCVYRTVRFAGQDIRFHNRTQAKAR